MDFLAVVSALAGWIYTFCWSLSFYPQALLNFRRRSTAGSTVDFPFINCWGFLAYLISNAALLYSPSVRKVYAERHHGLTPAVAFNDVAFAAHALVLSLVTTSQYLLPGAWGFKGAGGAGPRAARPSRFILGLAGGSVVAVAVVSVLAAADQAADQTTDQIVQTAGWTSLDVVYALGYVKLVITLVKYSPQVLANYRLRSTAGWSIWQILLDFAGGLLSFAQLLLDSARQGDWSGVTGNPAKLLLGNVSVAYDLVFFAQHYVLYRGAPDPADADADVGVRPSADGRDDEESREREALLAR